MASVAFSTAYFTPLHDFTQARTNPNPSPSWPSMPFIKTSFGSSKSAFFQHGFSQKTLSNLPGFLFKPRYFSVHARAATEKTIYDFTVKDLDRKDVPLSKFKGKVLLIVNVASRWYGL